MEKYLNIELNETHTWERIASKDCPQQRDSFNCGTFVIMIAYCLTKGIQLSTLSALHVKRYRNYIKDSIQQKELLEFESREIIKAKVVMKQSNG